MWLWIFVQCHKSSYHIPEVDPLIEFLTPYADVVLGVVWNTGELLAKLPQAHSKWYRWLDKFLQKWYPWLD